MTMTQAIQPLQKIDRPPVANGGRSLVRCGNSEVEVWEA